MKRYLVLGLVVCMGILIAPGCLPPKAPVVGFVYMNLDAFDHATGEPVGTKMGEGTCQSIVSVVAQGDCSIDSAAKKAKITKISHVDYHTESILGIISKVTVRVYGK